MSQYMGLPAAIGQVWGSIQRSVGERATTAEVWGNIKSELAASGYSLPAGSFNLVNQLRSLATTQRNSREEFAAAGSSEVIHSGMIAQTIYSKSLQDQALSPGWHVTFQAAYQTAAGLDYRNLTLVIPTLLPLTKGDLLSALTDFAASLADKYTLESGGGDLVDLGDIGILAVGS